jgi:hypothetical protein
MFGSFAIRMGLVAGIAQKDNPSKKHLRQIGAFAILLPQVAF